MTPKMTEASSVSVYLVGAGPGDPGLITLRGVEILRRADVVLYDFLVNPLILSHAPANTQRICLGRHGQGRLLPQDEINEMLVGFAKQGKIVVRLKGGDPAVFARVAEETEALAAAGVQWEIVPGITAALAAGSYAGIPLTHRDHTSAVALVTGQEQKDGGESKLDYNSIARFPGTLAIYMGVTTARKWTQALIAAGRHPTTPAVIVRRCSWSDQVVIGCRLETIADELEGRNLRPPVLVMIGAGCEVTEELSWFTRRPLVGQTVLVTRPEHQAYEMCRSLTEFGAGCLLQPAIEISPPVDWSPVDAALRQLDRYHWLVFSSANGVRFLLERICQQHGDLRRLGTIRLAAIGPGTANELAKYHLHADLLPTAYRAEALAEALADDAAGQRFLLARASRGREVLRELLESAGGSVDQVVVYQSQDVAQPSEQIAEMMATDRIDWITVTSSAIARSVVKLFGEQLRNVRIASISPLTSATLRDSGYDPAVEADEYTIDGIIAAIMKSV
ncbi:MAG: uroporphyrinogen-III C-methyltransferase [Planctomycetales bacterium]